MSLLKMAGHSVPTSIASLTERQWRLNGWSTRYIMGCGECPCDICSVPEQDLVYTINYDQDGNVTDETLDLSCVVESRKFPGKRVITINDKVKDCELTGCDGVSVCEHTKVYLTLCDAAADRPWNNNDLGNDAEVVYIYLTNNGVPVSEDEFGNPVPEYYVLGVGQIKYLCIVAGRITRIVN
jgi:hypothetical protein